MKAVVMAGGFGTRLRPLTYVMAKPTVPIAGKPCIYYTLRALESAGINDVIITSGYRVEDVMRSVGRYAGDMDLNIIYSYEYVPRGTAGGVKKVEAFLDETFLVTSGDVLCDVDYMDVVNYHRAKKALATMALTRVKNVSEYGVVQLDDDGRIVRFQEKPRPEEAFSDLINAGIYVLEPEVLDYVPKDTEFDFSKHTFPRVLEDGRGLYGHPLKGLWKDIGRPRDLLDANYRITKKMGSAMGDAAVMDEGGSLSTGVSVRDALYLGSGAEVMEGAELERAYLYRGVSVAKGCVINSALLLDHCNVGDNARIENSILGPGVKVGEGAEVINSIVVQPVEITAGSKIQGIRMWDKGLMYKGEF